MNYNLFFIWIRQTIRWFCFERKKSCVLSFAFEFFLIKTHSSSFLKGVACVVIPEGGWALNKVIHSGCFRFGSGWGGWGEKDSCRGTWEISCAVAGNPGRCRSPDRLRSSAVSCYRPVDGDEWVEVGGQQSFLLGVEQRGRRRWALMDPLQPVLLSLWKLYGLLLPLDLKHNTDPQEYHCF